MRKSEKKVSVLQLAMRERWRLANRILGPLLSFVRNGYARGSAAHKGVRPMNLALSHFMKFGFKGAYPDFIVDYEQLRIAEGMLDELNDVRLQRNGNRLNLQFDSQVVEAKIQAPDDIVSLIAYDPEAGEVAFAEGRRKDKRLSMNLPTNLQSADFHVYALVSDRERNQFANSLYLGSGV